TLNPKIARALTERLAVLGLRPPWDPSKAADSAPSDDHKPGGAIDWAFAESLAFGSLLLEGTPVRLTGQDCRRGTFSQRHAVLYDANTGESFTPLAALSAGQAPFWIFDSLLSETAVLGFEFGYSLDDPYTLVLWEAQFGDFANGAQVIIDQ